MRNWISTPLVIGIVGGIVGVLLMLALVHAYFDHRGFHELIDAINKSAAAASAKAPQP